MKTSWLLIVALLLSPALRAADIVQSPVPVVAPSAPLAPGIAVANGPLNFSITPAQALDQYHLAQADYLKAVAAVVAIPADQRTFENTIKAFETAGGVYADKIIRLQFLNQVSPSAELRAASDKIEEEDGKFNVSLGQRQDVYDAIKSYADRAEKLDEQDQRLLDATMRGFRRSGMGLSPEKREELKKLQERMVDLGKTFEKNINDDGRSIEVTADDLKGMPESYVQSVKTEDGKYVITTQYPHVIPLMAYSPNPALREKVYKLFNNRAAPQNLPVIEEALKNRGEMAKLLGYEGYPQMALDGRMAETPEKVMKFLNDLWPMLREKGAAELKVLLDLKRKDEPGAERLNAWDTKFYAEKLRKERFAVDQEKISEYFPVDRVVAGTMRSYERILGVKFTEVKDPEVWQQEVRLFRVEEPGDGKLIGYFYLDLYPRPNKYTHAAAFPLVLGRSLSDGKYNPPVSAMVANFTKPIPGQATLLKPDEVTTFFHEFGHIMHGVLTKARYASFAGTSVARDFVEGPSQMFENFVWDRGVLDEISGHYQDESKKLPEDMRLKIVAAGREFEDSGLPTGLHFLRQEAFAMADMIVHQAVPASLNELFNQLLSLISLSPQPPGTSMVSSFGHLMGGYGAGYYGYLWSLVFADDMYSRFAKEGVFSPVGMQYRREVLEQGSGRPEMESLRKFLGREPSSEAFLRRFKAERPSPGDQAAAKLLEKPVVSETHKAVGTTALWGVVEHQKGTTDIFAGIDGVVSAHDWSTGHLWWKRKFTTYMANATPENRAVFDQAGFQPIKKLNVRMTWSHVADMNGWGTGVNGEVRGRFTQDLQFDVEKLSEAFEVLEAFQKDPVAVLSRYPENEKWLRALGTGWDRGYVIASSIEVLTGDKAAKTERVLFSGSDRSGTYR